MKHTSPKSAATRSMKRKPVPKQTPLPRAKRPPIPKTPGARRDGTPHQQFPESVPRIAGLKTPQEQDEFREQFGQLLRYAADRWKDRTGGTFQELVVESVVSWTALFAWFRGQTTPNPYSLYRLAQMIGARVVFDGDGMSIEDENGEWMADKDGVWAKDKQTREWVLREGW